MFNNGEVELERVATVVSVFFALAAAVASAVWTSGLVAWEAFALEADVATAGLFAHSANTAWFTNGHRIGARSFGCFSTIDALAIAANLVTVGSAADFALSVGVVANSCWAVEGACQAVDTVSRVGVTNLVAAVAVGLRTSDTSAVVSANS